MKTCNKCNTFKTLEHFYKDKCKSDGYNGTCRECDELRKKNARAVTKNPVSVIEKYCLSCDSTKESKLFHKNKNSSDGLCTNCRDCRVAMSKKDYKNNSDHIRKRTMNYYQDNKKEIIKKSVARSKEKIKTDWKFKVVRNLRNRLWYALKFKSWKKDTHFAEYIGCDKDTLMAHIESSFLPGMTWENYGSKWHIDHIKPLSKSTDLAMMYARSHYTNLQALWGADNYSKGAKEGDELDEWLFNKANK